MVYPLSEQIENMLSECYDPETGELLVPEEEMFAEIERLRMDFEEKLDGIVCEIKNLQADAAAIKAEKDMLAERQRKAEEKGERLKRLMA